MLTATTLRSMPGRRGNVIGTLGAHALAVAIMYGTVAVLIATLRGPGIPIRLGAADLVVETDLQTMFDAPADSVPQGVPMRVSPETAEAIATIDGVERVVRDVTFAVEVVNAEGQPVTVSDDAVPRGQGWESAALTPFALIDGRAPQAADEAVIDARIARAGNISVDDETRIVTNRASAMYRLVGIAEPTSGEHVRQQASVFFTDHVAQSFARSQGWSDRIGVFVSDTANLSDVREKIAALPTDRPIRVLAGSDRAKADVTAGAVEVTELGIVLGTTAGFVGFAAIFVLSSTFGFSVQQRAREIGLQRAIGYTPGQVRRVILLEAVVIAVVGSAIGLTLGGLLAQVFTWVAIRAERAPEGFTVGFSSRAVVIVLSAAFGIALLAAWLASRRATRIGPIEALRSASVPPVWIGWKRLVVGLVFLGSGVVAVLFASSLPTDAAVAISMGVTMMMTIGCAILGAAVVLPFVRLMQPVVHLAEAITGELATANTRRMAARVAAAATPVMLGVSFMALMFNFTATIERATVQVSEEREIADLYALPVGTALPADVTARIAGIDGVDAVMAINTATVIEVAGGDAETVTVVDPAILASITNLEIDAGDITQFGPGTIVASESLAIDGVYTNGATLALMLPDGSTGMFTVAATAENLTGTGSLLMSAEDAVPHLVDATPTVAVNLTNGADVATVTSQIESLSAEGYPVEVATHDEYVAGIEKSVREGTWATYLVIGSAAAFGMLAVINTLTMATAERAREFALMRLIGATSGQILRMLAKEAAIVSVIGVVVGWGIALVSVMPVSIGLTDGFGAVAMPLLPLFWTGAVGAVVIFTSILMFGAMALRAAPVAEIGQKE